jgi:hypothetical protein
LLPGGAAKVDPLRYKERRGRSGSEAERDTAATQRDAAERPTLAATREAFKIMDAIDGTREEERMGIF